MDTRYLVLHRVRGEPAFDVAEKIQIGDEEGWIIPTSGHRAYPYKVWPIDNLYHEEDGSFTVCDYACEVIPEDWPDHYQEAEPTAKKGMGMPIQAIFNSLVPKIRRRM